MKVLFVVLYPRQAPSPRYRVYQLVDFLRSQGVECDVQSLVPEGDFVRSRRPGNNAWKGQMLARAFSRRLRLALRSNHYDLIYLLKGAFPYGPPVLERRFRAAGPAMIFDFDDAIHIHKASTHHRWLDRLKSKNRVPQTVRMVDQVVVPNDYLAEYSREFNDHVAVVHEAEDTERFTPRAVHTNNGRLVIGWVGSPSTVKYLKLIEPALRKLCERFPRVVLRVIGGEFRADGVRVEHVPWSLEREVELFQTLDIGIMPLPLEEWSKGKSGCKLRQYMASGVPGVATRIGYNCELVDDGETGLLVESQSEWVDALTKLIANPALRTRIADAARQKVVENYSIPVIGPQLLQVIESTVERAKRTSPAR